MEVVLENLKFVGQKYATEEEKKIILQKCDEYQMSKIVWVNDERFSDNTKDNYLKHYNNYFHNTELELKKDLKFFSKKEIENIIITKCTHLSFATIKSISSFCSTYCSFCVSKNEITINPCKEIKVADIVEKFEFLKLRLFSMDKFYNMCEEMIRKDNNKSYIKALLLARYGVMGKKAIFIRNLKYNDIDNMVINIRREDGSIIRKLPIDDRFIKMLIQLTDIDKKSDCNNIFESDEYVVSNRENRKIMKYTTMNSGINNICDSIKQNRISLGNLIFTRRIELLLNKRKLNKLTTEDVEIVVKEFNDNENFNGSTISMLKSNYEKLMSDTIYKRKNQNDLSDSNSKEFAENKAKEFGLNINDSLFIINYKNNKFIDFEYRKLLRKERVYGSDGKLIFPRDSKIVLNALKLANFRCELNERHETFVSNTTSENYVEAHHLIPIRYYYNDEFEFSIDNEANIVVLCPTCHRLLHYGRFEDKKALIEELYNRHKSVLKEVGIEIALDKLFEMYKECSKENEIA